MATFLARDYQWSVTNFFGACAILCNNFKNQDLDGKKHLLNILPWLTLHNFSAVFVVQEFLFFVITCHRVLKYYILTYLSEVCNY